MSKKLLKRWLPHPKTVKDHKSLQIFGTLLHKPNLWHLNRRSVARAVAIGLFFCFMPMPFQMVAAAAFAIILNANILLSVITVWISNPITMPPMLYFAYKVGALFLNKPPIPFDIELSWHWLTNKLSLIWQPLLLGSLICGSISAVAGFFLVKFLWRLAVHRQAKARQKKNLPPKN